MIDSNRTLRFNRTSREAYGYQVQFESSNDPLWWTVLAVVVAFFLGFMVGCK